MSVQAMAWVLEQSKSRLASRLVLLSLANHADQHGMNAWPSVTTIAREAHVSLRQAQRCLSELAGLGEVVVCLGGGPGRVNAYRILMGGDKLSPPPVTNPTSHGDKSGGAIRKNRPKSNRTDKPSLTSSDDVEEITSPDVAKILTAFENCGVAKPRAAAADKRIAVALLKLYTVAQVEYAIALGAARRTSSALNNQKPLSRVNSLSYFARIVPEVASDPNMSESYLEYLRSVVRRNIAELSATKGAA